MSAENSSDRRNTATTKQPTAKAAEPLRIDARTLIGDGREVVIIHAGREYRLRVTSNGKLILTA